MIRPAATTVGQTGIRARALLTVRQGKRGLTVPTRMLGEPPFHLQRIGRADTVPLQVLISGSCAGPLGGDQYTVDIDVGAGAALEFTSATAAVALPSSDRQPSRITTHIHVDTGGRLIWAPQPTICGGDSRHHTTTIIELGQDAGLIYRETLLLGPHGMPPAEAVTHIRATLNGKPLWDHETALGKDIPGGTGPAITAEAKVLQQTLLVRPDLWWHTGTHDIPAQVLAPGSCLLPLESGPALLINVLAKHVEEATQISAKALTAAGITNTP